MRADKIAMENGGAQAVKESVMNYRKATSASVARHHPPTLGWLHLILVAIRALVPVEDALTRALCRVILDPVLLARSCWRYPAHVPARESSLFDVVKILELLAGNPATGS